MLNFKKHSNFKLFSLFFTLTILILGLSISFQSLLAAWTAPPSAPPGDNVPAPLNVGNNWQTKDGGLWLVGNTQVAGASFIIEKGNVGIGTTSPQGILHLQEDKLNINWNTNTVNQLSKKGLIIESENPSIQLFGDESSSNQGRIKMIELNNDGIFRNMWAIQRQTTNAGEAGDGSLRFAYTTSGDGYHWSSDEVQKVTILPNGNVGIGTTDPDFKLTIAGEGPAYPEGEPEIAIHGASDDGMLNPGIRIKRHRGTMVSPDIVQDDDQLFAIHVYGYDGVLGNNSEAAEITVETDGAPSAGNIPGRLEFRTTAVGGGSNAETRMVIKSNGNVGIGTTDPQNPLKVYSKSYSVIDWLPWSGFGTRCPCDNDITVRDCPPKRFPAGTDSIGDECWDVSDAAWDVLYKVKDTSFVMDELGNVGIGTSSAPESGLLVAGDCIVIRDSSPAIIFDDFTGFDNFRIEANEDYMSVDADLGKDGTWDTRIMTLLSNANVGIGTTTPDAQLHLAGDAANAGELCLESKGSSAGIKFKVTGDSSDFMIKTWQDRLTFLIDENRAGTLTAPLNILPNGNVGIGTTTPKVQLHLAGDSPDAGELLLESPDNSVGITFKKRNDNSTYGIKTWEDKLQFFVDDRQGLPSSLVRAMVILPNSNVGIGEINPQAVLHVNDGAVDNGVHFEVDEFILEDGSPSLVLRDTDAQGYPSTDWQLASYSTNKFHIRAVTPDVIRFTILENGNVGIGTEDPEALLHIYGNGAGQDELILQNTGAGGASVGIELIKDNYSRNYHFKVLATGLTIAVDDRVGVVVEALTVDADSNIGIGDNTPDFKLDVQGTAGKPGGGTWSDASDIRLKKNVEKINGQKALEKITALEGILFEWINPEEHSYGQKAGLSAQELEKIFPDWINQILPEGKDKEFIPSGDKVKAITFPHDFNAYLIEAIKELKSEKDSEINELQTQINTLTDIICELKPEVEICD